MKKSCMILMIIVTMAACKRPVKELATVEIGMTKTEVLGLIGEPKKKDVINKTEIWDYPDSSRTVVFRADTVYSIMTSPKARLDSVGVWLDSTNQKIKKGFGNMGDKIDNAADKIQDQLSRDSSIKE